MPVIASRWNGFDDVVIEGKTGVGYSFGDNKDFKDKLMKLLSQPEKIFAMKKECLKIADEYRTDVVINEFCKNLI